MITRTVTNLAALHQRALEGFAAQVDALEPDHWTLPTPCADWNVRALVNHVAIEDLWTPPLLAGRTIADVGDAFDGDRIGAVPPQAVHDAAAGAIAAAAETGALERVVHLSFGDVPATEYVWQVTADHLIHGWDLARAVGADERLDPELVDACADWFADNEDAYRAAGAIGPRAAHQPRGPQEQLLVAFGRQP
ncbi:TIGR03086 family metal-binding protein [Nitriliruptor alkaliphilus]|uniref:TIGR03086 family metal-binding protein n=1 Tax=Nitriliruptor alkaliphilus TaxID=427918 RepID=UPI000695E31B|nr:TIGR03086 family metal-binding protein [Nitriliruptor alkaliphilus]